MSISEQSKNWGPSHQYLPPPRDGKSHLLAWSLGFGFVAFELFFHRVLSSGASSAASSTIHTLARFALGLGVLALLLRGLQSLRGQHSSTRSSPPPPVIDAAAVRAQSLRLGGGAYLGLAPGGRWVTADPEHAVMVLGPPRSGKTGSIVIPSVLAAPGAVVSTATKPDVMNATWRARAEVGQVWLYDPSGELSQWPRGIRRLCWSPVPAAATWDGALLMARAMAAGGSSAKGTTNEHHWRERSTALLAPLLHAAHVTDRQITQVLTWVLRAELEPARKALEDHGAQVAADVLAGIAKTDERERSSILSATAGVLSAYNSDAVRRNAAHPNFDVHRFVASCDTLYITAPAHKQALCAPLVIGLLEQIRHATYLRAGEGAGERCPPLYMCLDEVANMAPIHDLPALVSEAGGQGLHVMVCLQDLSQVRRRWGDSSADGFLSLFQTKVVLDGIADPKTLEAISLCLGEYDRQLVTHTLGRSETREPIESLDDLLKRPRPTETESVAYHTHRQRTLSPGEIARLPPGRALHLVGTRWGLVRSTPWHRTLPWMRIAQADASPGGDASDPVRGHPGALFAASPTADGVARENSSPRSRTACMSPLSWSIRAVNRPELSPGRIMLAPVSECRSPAARAFDDRSSSSATVCAPLAWTPAFVVCCEAGDLVAGREQLDLRGWAFVDAADWQDVGEAPQARHGSKSGPDGWADGSV
jgi:type IV secretion system protein VirD4